ncbi:hypothetical protein SESBI_38137 [Sesbania bispinosa]|nr:hypothetical protein SESBI_38137 [Sesbania bispinosa]
MTVSTRRHARETCPQPTLDGWVEEVSYHDEGFGDIGTSRPPQTQLNVIHDQEDRTQLHPGPRDEIIRQLQAWLLELEAHVSPPPP